MGNGMGVIIGVVLIVIGIIVAILTGTGVMAQAIMFEFLSALQLYFIGMIIAIIFIVVGGLILLFMLRS